MYVMSKKDHQGTMHSRSIAAAMGVTTTWHPLFFFTTYLVKG